MASIRKLPDGRFQAQYRAVPNGRQYTRITKKKGDAQRWLDEQTAALVSGQYVAPDAGRETFAQYFATWSTVQVWEAGTTRAMKLAADSVTFGHLPLRSIQRSHIEAWVKAMQTKPRGKDEQGEDKPRGLAPGTIKTRFNNVRCVLRAAVRDRKMVADPSEGVTLPRVRRAEASMTLPTAVQVGGLLRAADDSVGALVALCAFAGLRLGEAAALQVGDVNFLGRELVVRRQVQRENGGGVEIRAPKYGSERKVYLADELVAILARHVKEQVPGSDPRRWMFPGEGLHPLHQNSVGHHWRKARTEAGCPTVRMHDLRHFYASGLIAAGCDVVTVQRALGHASAMVTLTTYAHLWPSAEDRTRAASGAMLREILSADESLTNASAGS